MRLVFVCSGNICRSPLAEALARHHLERAGLASRVTLESFGTHGLHAGDGADPRTVATARRFGIDLDRHRARRIDAGQLRGADLALAMDSGHVEHLQRLDPAGRDGRVQLYLPWLGLDGRDVPDPYYGDADGFVAVHQMLDRAAQRLVERLPGLLASRDG
jgi:protein-tyrosine phosphatase